MQKAGEKIKILIRSKGWLQEDFADHIGYDRSHLSRLLGYDRFNPKQIDKFANGLGMESQVLLQILESEDDVGRGIVPDKVAEPTPRYTPASDRVAALEKENQLLRDELEEMRRRLVEEKLISDDLSEKLRQVTKRD